MLNAAAQTGKPALRTFNVTFESLSAQGKQRAPGKNTLTAAQVRKKIV